MAMTAWILFCMLASIGLVQCGFWLAESLSGRHGGAGLYHLVTVYNDPDQVEAVVRSALSGIRRRGVGGEDILLVDMGLSEECRQICDRLVCEYAGTYICERERLSELVERLEAGGGES